MSEHINFKKFCQKLSSCGLYNKNILARSLHVDPNDSLRLVENRFASRRATQHTIIPSCCHTILLMHFTSYNNITWINLFYTMRWIIPYVLTWCNIIHHSLRARRAPLSIVRARPSACRASTSVGQFGSERIHTHPIMCNFLRSTHLYVLVYVRACIDPVRRVCAPRRAQLACKSRLTRRAHTHPFLPAPCT